MDVSAGRPTHFWPPKVAWECAVAMIVPPGAPISVTNVSVRKLFHQEGSMIQGSYKGIEIEMELHELEHGGWRCDYTLIKHPERTETIHHGDQGFPTMDLAREYALHDARVAIDRTS